MIWKVQNELKKLIDIDDITQELLHKLIYKNEYFHYLTDYSGGELSKDNVTLEFLRGYIGFMLNDKGLAPTTAIVDACFSSSVG